MKPRPPIPLATYRLQLNRHFTFNQASSIVPYLSELGVSHCYISPCLKARPGSMHGYDIVDHNSFNPEIGTEEEFESFVGALHSHGMGLILDIVPNHMGIMGSDNAWWLDVLENGESSMYASFFDIDWRPLKEELHGKVLVPVLGDHYGAELEKGNLKLVFHPEGGEFYISYHEHRFPIDPKEYPQILKHCATGAVELFGDLDTNLVELQNLIIAFGQLPARQETSGKRVAERNRDKEILKRRLSQLCSRSTDMAACIARVVELINGHPADPSSFEELHELIKAQAFRLANWRVASDDINYRRFFDTNDLAGICMEKESVFEATHRLVLNLIAAGKVDGLRLDHPDGLYDPAQYFERLHRSLVNATAKGTPIGREPPVFVVIEKILTGAERLPANWTVCGTTGYDFSNLVNGLFVDPAAVRRLERSYRTFSGEETEFDDLAYRSRKLIIRVTLASELNVLANKLARIALSKRRTCDFTLNSLRDALTEVVASFPVYRTYVSRTGVSANDARYIHLAIASAKWRSPAADTSIFDFIGEVLLTRIADGQDAPYRDAVTSFAMRFQQFSSPVMAKGIEDTAFYRYNRLISLNDVGADLQRFGVTRPEFHFANQERLRSWPNTMLATSTHDSKRSEDVRARIDVLSEISGLWRLRLRDWKRFNRKYKRMVNDELAPSSNDEYLLYQTLVGAWPFETNTLDRDNWTIFAGRIEAYMLKAIREAKRNTSWINNNTEYEGAVSSFVKALLDRDRKNRFVEDFEPFQRRVARVGVWNSLSQMLLKLSCPGVPDIYQGTEVLDLSLVDPDNRRPVDYVHRERLLESVRTCHDSDGRPAIKRLLENPDDGRLKLYLTWKALCLRQQERELFQCGTYVPLTTAGTKENHIVAFGRRHGNTELLVIVPRLIATILSTEEKDQTPVGTQVWEDTRILLPNEGERTYHNVLTGKTLNFKGHLEVADVLADFPVALCIST